jgi:hypothetical protein
MLLDRGNAIDALVVGVCVVVRGDETLDLCIPQVPQRLDPEMAVEQEVPIRMIAVADCPSSGFSGHLI